MLSQMAGVCIEMLCESQLPLRAKRKYILGTLGSFLKPQFFHRRPHLGTNQDHPFTFRVTINDLTLVQTKTIPLHSVFPLTTSPRYKPKPSLYIPWLSKGNSQGGLALLQLDPSSSPGKISGSSCYNLTSTYPLEGLTLLHFGIHLHSNEKDETATVDIHVHSTVQQGLALRHRIHTSGRSCIPRIGICLSCLEKDLALLQSSVPLTTRSRDLARHLILHPWLTLIR